MLYYAVVWIPNNQTIPTTCSNVLKIGGRIIDQHLSKLDAEKVEHCLKINGEGLSGEYMTITE